MRILVLLYSKPRKTELDKINVRWLTTKNTSKPIFERVWSAVFNEASKLIWSYIIVNNWQVYTIITGTHDEDYKRTFRVSIFQLYHKPCLNTIPQTVFEHYFDIYYSNEKCYFNICWKQVSVTYRDILFRKHFIRSSEAYKQLDNRDISLFRIYDPFNSLFMLGFLLCFLSLSGHTELQIFQTAKTYITGAVKLYWRAHESVRSIRRYVPWQSLTISYENARTN